MPNLHERLATQGFARLEVGRETFRFHRLPDGSADPNDAYTRANIETVARVGELLEERERLIQDGRFTPKGIRARLAKRADELARTEVQEKGASVDENLARIGGYLTNLPHTIARLRQKLEGPPEPESDVEAAQYAEVRAFLREKDDTERRRVLTQAQAEGREDLLVPALTGPAELSGLTPDQQESLRDRYVRENNPDLIQEVEAHEKAYSALQRTAETAKEALRAIATEPIPEPEEEGAAA